jgi:hypothetical protein
MKEVLGTTRQAWLLPVLAALAMGAIPAQAADRVVLVEEFSSTT